MHYFILNNSRKSLSINFYGICMTGFSVCCVSQFIEHGIFLVLCWIIVCALSALTVCSALIALSPIWRNRDAQRVKPAAVGLRFGSRDSPKCACTARAWDRWQLGYRWIGSFDVIFLLRSYAFSSFEVRGTHWHRSTKVSSTNKKFRNHHFSYWRFLV